MQTGSDPVWANEEGVFIVVFRHALFGEHLMLATLVLPVIIFILLIAERLPVDFMQGHVSGLARYFFNDLAVDADLTGIADETGQRLFAGQRVIDQHPDRVLPGLADALKYRINLDPHALPLLERVE